MATLRIAQKMVEEDRSAGNIANAILKAKRQRQFRKWSVFGVVVLTTTIAFGTLAYKINQRETLKDMATNSSFQPLREFAAWRLEEDLDALEYAAMNSPYFSIRIEAVLKISKHNTRQAEEVLAQIAIGCLYENTRMNAIRNMGNEQLLKEVVLSSHYISSRLLALKKISNPDILQEIALSCTHHKIIEEAMEGLSKDIEKLKSIISTSRASYAGSLAINKLAEQASTLTDHQALYYVAMYSEKYQVREIAVERLRGDIGFLSRISMNTTNRQTSLYAISMLRNNTSAIPVLTELAKTSPIMEIHLAAVERLGEMVQVLDGENDAHRDTLRVLAMYSLVYNIRRTAIQQLTNGRIDDLMMHELAKHCKFSDVRLAALERITDGWALKDIAMDSRYPDVRLAATNRIRIVGALEEIVNTCPYEDSRQIARRLLNQNI